MKCIQCNQEFKSKRKTAKFCSAKCRMAFSRVSVTKGEVSVTDSVLKDSVTRDSTSTDRVLSPVVTGKDLKDYTAQDLYDAIDSYPMDAWVYSPEFKELKRRLGVLSVVELRSEGYRVSNWKMNEV